MREVRFLCLAVSRRDGGTCIAGIDIDSGRWIRPINVRTHGAFGYHEIFVVDGETKKFKIMQPLDVVHLRIEKYVGDNCQPENWEVAPASYLEPYPLLRRFGGQEDVNRLIPYLDQTDRLLHGYSASVQESDVQSHMLTHSLSLTRPDRLYWEVSDHPYHSNKLQVRADFLFDQLPYNLAVTDPVWEGKCRQLGKGRHPHSKILGDATGQVLLTISLAGVPLDGFHYKLVAGVINLPV